MGGAATRSRLIWEALARQARKAKVAQGDAPARRGRARVVLAASVFFIAVLSGGGLWLTRGGASRGELGLSVLLITIDTLRAAAAGAYGKAEAGTPWMGRLAAAGVRFEDARAHNVVTLASHANILSGRYPTDHGVRDNSGFRFPAGIETLATLLQARGYATGAFVSAFPLASRFGLARGFDVYDDSFVDAEARPAFLEQERRGPETVALAQRWVEAHADRPFFCWVHIYEPHAPYAPAEPFASRFRSAPYQGEVAAADAAARRHPRPGEVHRAPDPRAVRPATGPVRNAQPGRRRAASARGAARPARTAAIGGPGNPANAGERRDAREAEGPGLRERTR